MNIRAKEKNLTLIFDIQKDIPSEYFGDDIRLRQILNNLLTNAVKYTQTGTVTAEDVKAALNGNENISLTKCKIWLETTSKKENLTYAVMATKDSASGEGQESEEIRQSDKEVLESLNFKLSEDSSYKTDDITSGRQYVQEYDEYPGERKESYPHI